FKLSDTWNLTADYGTSRLVRQRYTPTLNPTNLVTGAGVMTISMQHSVFGNKNGRIELAGTFYTGPVINEVLIGASRNVKDAFTPTAIRALCPGATPTAPQVACTQNFYQPHPIPVTPFPSVFVADTTRIDDRGAYVFERAKITEQLQLLAGIRKSDYTESDVTRNVDTFHATPFSHSYGVVYKV